MYTLQLSPKELRQLHVRRKQEKNPSMVKRLQCIYLAQLGKGNNEIAKLIMANKNSVTDWIKIYSTKGLNVLCHPINYNRRSAKIDPYITKIKQDIKDNTITTLSELQDWIKTKYSLNLEQSWLWRCCKKNSICLTKRPG